MSKDFAKQEEWDVDVAAETKEAHPRMAEPYLVALKKADIHARELQEALAQCRLENERLKAEVHSQPTVNIFIGGRTSDVDR